MGLGCRRLGVACLRTPSSQLGCWGGRCCCSRGHWLLRLRLGLLLLCQRLLLLLLLLLLRLHLLLHGWVPRPPLLLVLLLPTLLPAPVCLDRVRLLRGLGGQRLAPLLPPPGAGGGRAPAAAEGWAVGLAAPPAARPLP